MQRILRVIHSDRQLSLPAKVLAEYHAENITWHLQIILEELNEFFDHKQVCLSDIQDLNIWQIMKLRSQRIFAKLKKRLN